MKPTLLSVSLLLAMNTALAAEPAARAAPAAAPAAAAVAAAKADASAAAAPALDATQAAAAREELGELRTQIGELSRRMADLSMKLGDVGPRAYALRYLNEPDRAIVGVVLGPNARIDALTPDGPADRAGLRSGDRITRINGAAIDARDAGKALEAARKALGDLKDGQDVRIAYARDGAADGEVRMKAQRREALNWPSLIANADANVDANVIIDKQMRIDIDTNVRESMQRAREAMAEARIDYERANAEARRAGSDATQARANAGQAREQAERALQHAEIARIDSLRHAMPWWGISLASLNDDLGRYFGSDRGVLVLSASPDTLPDLKAGDVIRKVDGAAVTRPEDALRALRDQPTGSTVDLDVLRDRKALVLKVKVPEYKSIFSIGRAAPLPPAPPSPVDAPAPPAPPVAPGAPDVAPPAGAPPAPVAPPPPPSPMAGATAVALSAEADPRRAMVSPEVARKGDSAGAPALWGGEIIDTQARNGSPCARVRSYRLDANGKPVRGFANRTDFLACGAEPLDARQFRPGGFATFAGHVQAVEDGRSGAAMPVMLISDARAWKSMPSEGLTPPTPTAIPSAGR